jgi:hypothetical protein
MTDSVLALDATINRLMTSTDKLIGSNALLQGSLDNLGITVDDNSVRLEANTSATDDLADAMDDVIASSALLQAALANVGNRISSNSARLTINSAALRANTDALSDLTTAVLANAGALGVQSTAARASGASAVVAGRGWYGLWGILGRKVTLFGGAFGGTAMIGSIAVWHLLAEVILETAAVLIPASIALAAWGEAASQGVQLIYQRFTNLETVVQGTGQWLAPFTGGLQRAQNAANPQVYELLGDAIEVAGKKSGDFAKLSQATGTVVDQLGERITAALTSGGLDKFMANAVPDLSKLGNLFGNLFGVIGNLLNAVPGYAEKLLTLGVAISGVLEWVTRVAEPFIAFGLAMHGAIIWIGLLVSAAVLVEGVLAGWFVELVALGIEMVQVAGDAGLFAAAMVLVDATGGPIVWIAAALAGLAFLAAELFRTRSAGNALASSFQSQIDSAPSITAAFDDIGEAQAAMTQQVAISAKALNETQKTGVIGSTRFGDAISGVTAQYQKQYGQLTSNQQALNSFNAQADLSAQRLGVLAVRYGGVGAALGLLNAAGITEAQWQDKSAAGWLLILNEVQALALGYEAMGQKAGTLGNDLNVLDKVGGEALTDMQKLNTAWQQQTALVTGSQEGFDTYAQGLATLSSAQTTAVNTLGKYSDTVKLAGGVMDGLSPSSIALNQAFADQVTNTDALISTWRSAGIVSGQFTTGVKAAIEPLMRYAAGSQDATAMLVSLAEEAGYQGPVSFKALTAWLGKVHDATRTVQGVTETATIAEANLTTAMQGQGSYITTTLLNDLSEAELKYSPGLVGAVTAYGKAVTEHGLGSAAANTAAQSAIDKIVTYADKVGLSTQNVITLGQKLTGLPRQTVIDLVLNAEGKVTMIYPTTTGKPLTPNLFPGAAAGMFVTGGEPGKDSVLIKAMPGELVVPKHVVDKGAVDHLRGTIPGFASGGLVAQASSDVATMVSDSESDVIKATQAAITAANTAGAMVSAAYGSGGSGGANAALARRMYPPWASGAMWNAWNYVGMKESGWSDTAVNPSSGAAGIAQRITGFGPGYEAGNAAQQIAWMIQYIIGRYGNPLGAAAHEMAFNWYDQGGFLAPGLTMAVNATGQPERVLPPGPIEMDPKAIALLADIADSLDNLQAIEAVAPAQTAAGVASTLGSAARAAGYRNMYNTRS